MLFVLTIVGFLKGKSALCIANRYSRRRKYRGYHFWARGYFVSTVDYNEKVIRQYIKDQEKKDKASDQATLFKFF